MLTNLRNEAGVDSLIKQEIMNIEAYTKTTMGGIPLIVQCCVCRKIRHKSGRWDAIIPPPNTEVSHTYCETCAQQVLQKMRDENKRRKVR